MNIQAHPGLQAVGLPIPATTQGRMTRASRRHTGPRTVTVVAAVAIQAIVAAAAVGMIVGLGAEHRAPFSQPGAAPFVTPAPEAAPGPNPGF